MSKTYSITNQSTGERHDIHHDDHINCIHCHFTLYSDRYRYITFEDYKNTYKSDILSKLHTGCKYYDCKVCESLGKNEK